MSLPIYFNFASTLVQQRSLLLLFPTYLKFYLKLFPANLKLQPQFAHSKGFGCIPTILEVLEYFGNFRGFNDILANLVDLGIFQSSRRFLKDIFVILEVYGVFHSSFWNFKDIFVILEIYGVFHSFFWNFQDILVILEVFGIFQSL